MARVRGIFDDWEAFKGALRSLKETQDPSTGSGWHYTAYGPVNLQEVEDLMPAKSSLVRGWATSCGIVGLVTFFVMCVTTSLIYGLIVGGKPPVSNLPYVIPTYEGTILFGAIGAFIAGLVYACVKARPLPADYDTRFSGDCFGIDVDCMPEECDRLTDLLKNAGAVEVYEP